jgi:hypothetical protein
MNTVFPCSRIIQTALKLCSHDVSNILILGASGVDSGTLAKYIYNTGNAFGLDVVKEFDLKHDYYQLRGWDELENSVTLAK